MHFAQSPERRYPSPDCRAMAACLSFPSSPPKSTLLRLPLSSFKGNLASVGVRVTFSFSSLAWSLRQSFSSPAKPLIRCQAASVAMKEAAGLTSPVRFRLDNLGPQPGSRKRRKRKGRGTSAGQGNSCGFGMKGQKARSGPGVRKGFEGGQTPLYRRLPKLRGIAGGMPAGLPKFVPVNLKDIEAAGFQEDDVVSLESLKEKGVINPSGRERKLPLKILAEGDLSIKLSIKAGAFSAAAKEKLEASGCRLTVLPGRKKWMKPSVLKNLARADEYFAKKRAAMAAE